MKMRSLRFRLTTWYFVVLAVTFCLLGGGVWAAMRQSVHLAVDEELQERLKGVHQFLEWRLPLDSLEGIRVMLRRHSSLRPGGDLLQVSDNQGNWIYQSDSIRDYAIVPSTPVDASRPSRFATIQAQRIPFRVLSARLVIAGRPYGVQLAAPLSESYEMLRRFGWVLLSALPAALILATLGGYWMSRRALAPVDEITNAARSISVQNLSRRLAIYPTGDELERLSVTLNEMLARLESAFHRIAQFTADASHELRTPMTLMRTTAELALHRDRSAVEYRQALVRILAELERTSHLIEKLLTLARADAGAETLRIAPMDLAESVREVCGQGQTLAQVKKLAFDVRVPEKPVPVEGDLQALRRLFLILIDNAIKYTPAGGQVVVALHTANGFAVGEVRDSGIGILAADLPHIFERFYRADKARSRAAGGAGLGLSIARWIAQGHRGDIQVESTPGQGSNFQVRLPLSANT